MPVEIRPMDLPRDAMRFVKAWWPIYAGDPRWVPPLLTERKQFFDPKQNPYFQHADIQCFAAFKDGRIAGTISAQVDHRLQQSEPGTGLFGFFEFEEDEEVAARLIEAAAGWLRERGMTDMQGPFNFSANHEFGLLVDGFDTDPMLLNPHARAWYGPICERIGLEKRKDWYAYWLPFAEKPPEAIQKIADRFLERHPEVTLRPADMKNFDREIDVVFDIYNDAWEDNWGHVHMSEAEIRRVAKDLKQILDPNLVWIAEVDGEAVGVAITLWDFNQVAKKMNGRILPFGWWHYVFGRGSIDAVRIYVLGIKKKYQRWPLGAPLYVKIWESAVATGRKIRGGEASLILEDNFRMRGAIEKLGGEIYKTYRIYGKKLV